MKPRSKQQGAALIIALVIMSIAMAIAANILFRQQLSTRLAVNVGHLEQAYPYANAIEDFARNVLRRDYEDDPEKDDLEEVWATPVNPIIDGGTASARLIDLQSKLNINNLMPYDPDADEIDPFRTAPPLSDEEKELVEEKFYFDIASIQTQALLAVVDPDQTVNTPESFVDIVKDWIDGDSNVSAGGAESSDYQIEDTAYNAGNTPMVSPTELRLLKDVDKDNFELIRQHFSTLPEYTLVNVNTADETTLQALGFTAEAAENIITVREEAPFPTLDDFKELAVVEVALEDPDGPEGEQGPAVYEESLSVSTQYFLLQGEITIGTARIYMNSILYRNDGKVTVISRDFSNQQVTENQ
ncbi:general secretion pathway protein GspK [Leucothrix sargassi]|nr:general secretion pathway protein GspK [Leucothrix sargassi]